MIQTLISTISAASTATSVPVLIAMPTLAWASAGESFTPSPTIATMWPVFCNSFTLFTLSDGNVSANTDDTPTCHSLYNIVQLLLMTHWQSKVKFSHICYRALGLELIPVYRQSANVTFSVIPGGRLPLLSAKPAVTFPAEEHHRPLTGTKLYCLMTKAHRYEHLPKVVTKLCPGANWTHDQW